MPVTPGASEGGKARYEALSTTDAGPVDSPDEGKPAARVVRHASLAKGYHGSSLYIFDRIFCSLLLLGFCIVLLNARGISWGFDVLRRLLGWVQMRGGGHSCLASGSRRAHVAAAQHPCWAGTFYPVALSQSVPREKRNGLSPTIRSLSSFVVSQEHRTREYTLHSQRTTAAAAPEHTRQTVAQETCYLRSYSNSGSL